MGHYTLLAGTLSEFTLEYPCHSPNEQRWFLLSAAPLHTPAGGAVVSHINITQRKQAEEALHDQQRFTQSLIDTAPSVLYVFDIRSRRNTYLTLQAAKALGYSYDQLANTQSDFLQQYMHPDDLPRIAQHFEAIDLARNDQMFEFEYRMRHASGRWCWFRSRDMVFQRDVDGRPEAILGVAIDVTERKQAEFERQHLLAQLQDAEARYRAVFQASAAGIALLRADGGFVATNPAYEKIVGYSSDELRTMAVTSIVHPDDLPAQWSLFEELAAGKRQIYDIETRFIRKDGEIRWGSITASMICDSSGAPWYGLGITVDITDHKRAEEERLRLLRSEQEARAQAQEAVRVHKAFLSVAAHELKNPLTSLLGNAQLLQRRAERAGTYPERDMHALTIIAEQAARMNQFIAALLDVAQLETGHLRLNLGRLNLVALIQRVLDDLQPTLTQHSLVWHGPPDPVQISGDELRLTQVLHNLIGNAVKYSPHGGRITVRVINREEQVCVAISDEGIGIPAEAIPNLFQRFYRANTTETQKISGTGVGLYVVKEIVTLHGGTVEVASTEGNGSTFTVCLPRLQETDALHERQIEQ